MLVDMRVRIDQTRGDEEAGGVDHLGFRAGHKLGRDRRDAALADADIADRIDPVGRVDDPPAGDDRVIVRAQFGNWGDWRGLLWLGMVSSASGGNGTAGK